jgi:hypothetical protein
MKGEPKEGFLPRFTLGPQGGVGACCRRPRGLGMRLRPLRGSSELSPNSSFVCERSTQHQGRVTTDRS